jgi:hypothetical protein
VLLGFPKVKHLGKIPCIIGRHFMLKITFLKKIRKGEGCNS